MRTDKNRAIVVKRVAAAPKGRHTGAWKLAYADFMTAMMAFFLLMWLLASASTPQLRGIAEYFNQPLKITLWGGDRSAEDSSIVKGGGRDVSSEQQGVTHLSNGTSKRAVRSETRNQRDETVQTIAMRLVLPRRGCMRRSPRRRGCARLYRYTGCRPRFSF